MALFYIPKFDGFRKTIFHYVIRVIYFGAVIFMPEQGQARIQESSRAMEETAQDYISHLPDDVLLSILSGMDDLKLLLQCSLVSKRFAAMISAIKAVSVTLPSMAFHSPETRRMDISELFPALLNYNGTKLIDFIKSLPIPELKVIAFLQNFTELRSISFEFVPPTIFCDPPYLTWKPKFSSSGEVVGGIVSLLVNAVFQLSGNEIDNLGPAYETPQPFSLSHIRGCVFLPIRCCKEWLFIVFALLKCNPTLTSVSITNSKKEAKIVLKNEKLTEWRTNLLCGKLLSMSYPDTMKMAWMPQLYLPSSKLLLRGVCFAAMRFPSDSDESIEEYVMNCKFRVEEKMLAEVVKEMFTTHRERLRLLSFTPVEDDCMDDDQTD